MTSRIGFICGSLRDGSINRRLQAALRAVYDEAGFETEMIDLADYPLPIFDADAEVPEALDALVERVRACDGVVVVTPEYNGGLPALLKNAIDYMSTKGGDTFRGRVWAVAACTPGPLSGVVVLRSLVLLLMRIGGRCAPTMVGVGNAAQAFEGDRLPEDGLGHKLATAQADEMKRALAAG